MNIIPFLTREDTESSITAQQLTHVMLITRQQDSFTLSATELQNAYYEAFDAGMVLAVSP